ncbi:MAG TPA: PKD domain-containing protein, partial [Candidatus Paceibacterota bacterium]
MNRLNIARTLPILGLSLLCVAHAHAITLSPSQVSSTGYGIATYEAEWGGGLCILLGTCVTTPPPPTPLAGSFSHSSTYSSGAMCASGGTAVSGGAYGQPPSGFYSNPGAYCVPTVSGGLSIGDSYPTYLYYPSGHASVVSQPPTTSYIQTGGMCVSGFGCAGGEVPYTTSYGAYLFSSTCSANYGNSCNSANNACGVHNTGTYSCSGTCSASVPANPPTYGKTCTSAPNSCGMTNTGTYGCTGACSATPPSDTLCAPVASCTVSPSSGYAGRTAFTWTASASGGNGSYTYSWSGTDGLSGSSASVSKTYATAGAKTGTVTVTSNGKPASAACTVSGGGSAITVNSCNPTLSA